MIFKTLVECILKKIRDPDNHLAFQALQSVTREIEHDLTQAFMLSRPLVDRYSTLFWKSRSYLDFLINIAQLPSPNNYFARSLNPETLSVNRCDVTDFENDFSSYTHKNNLEENETLLKKPSDLDTQLQMCKRNLNNCTEEKDYLNTQIKLLKTNRNDEHVSRNDCPSDCAAKTCLEACNQELEKCRIIMNKNNTKISELQETLNNKNSLLSNVQEKYNKLKTNWETCMVNFETCNQVCQKVIDQNDILWKQMEAVACMYDRLQLKLQATEAEWLKEFFKVLKQNENLEHMNVELKTSLQKHQNTFKHLQDDYTKVTITECNECDFFNPHTPSSNPTESKFVCWKEDNASLETENATDCDNKIETDDKIISDLMQLTPDMDLGNSPNKWKWKKKFIERYNSLAQCAKSLLGTKPIKNLPNLLYTLQTQAGNDPELNWLYLYIEKLKENNIELLNIKEEKLYNVLYEQCEKLASYFNIVLNIDSFYNDILNSEKMTNCITLTSLYDPLKNYFTLSNVNMFLIIQKIDMVFRQLTSPHSIFVSNVDDYKSNFEAHVNVYWNAVKQDITKWENDYNEWLKQLHLNATTERQGFITAIQKQRNDEWYTLYNQWLHELELEGTPREQFLEKLKTYKTREKRILNTPSDSFEVSHEKKMKLHENWSETEIQNLFSALYREYFTLKWNILKKMSPIDTELKNKLNQKLQLLEQIDLSIRDSFAIKIYMQYVKLDLAALVQKVELFTEITSRDNLLEISMNQTEKYIEYLYEGKN